MASSGPMTSSPPGTPECAGRDTTNMTNSGSSAMTGKTLGGDEENDGGESDSSANDGSASASDEADVKALSGVAQLSMQSDGHLAGKAEGGAGGIMTFLDEDVDMAESTQASAGAEEAASDLISRDDDYAGLAGISDDSISVASEDQDILAEQDLVDEYMAQPDNVLNEMDLATQDFDPFGYNETGGFTGLSLDTDPFAGATLFGEQWEQMAGSADIRIKADWERDQAMQSNDRPKRVRFQEMEARPRSPSPSSSEDSEDEADAFYPDIFVAQDDPKIRSIMGGDLSEAELAGYGSDAGSVYDFDEEAERFPFDPEDDDDSGEYDSESESSDESDEDGYDTEEETPEDAQKTLRSLQEAIRKAEAEKKAAAALTASAPATPTGGKKRATVPLVRSSSTGKSSASKTNKGPRKGTFECDPTKATIVSDATGKNTVLYLPTNPEAKDKAFWDRARSAVDSRDSSPRGSMSISMPSYGAKEETPQRPFTVQSTLGSMFDGNFDFMSSTGATPAPPARLLPRSSLQSSFNPVPSSFASAATTDEASDGEEEFPGDINMLVNFDSDSDTEEPTSPVRPSSSAAEPSFLSRGVVGSFRLNQVRAREESSLALHPADRASTSELNALQTGRRGAGNAPITPARKKRVSRDLSKTASGIRKPAMPSAASSPLSARRRGRGQSLSGRLDQTFAPDVPIWKK